VEAILSESRFLVSNTAITEADIRLFQTLVRFDAVYVVYFKVPYARPRF
jgi:putative glutathione S-transferase